MSRVVVNAKAEIYAAMCATTEHRLSADKRWAAYIEALGMYISRRLSKRELDKVVCRVLGIDNLRKHNALLLALLADATRRSVDPSNKMPPAKRPPPIECDEEDDDEEFGRLLAEWRKTGGGIAPPRHKSEPLFPRRSLVAHARLDGAGLVAMKMDEASVELGLDGVSASAVHLVSLAIDTYARRVIKQCHSEFLLQRQSLEDDDFQQKNRTQREQRRQTLRTRY